MIRGTIRRLGVAVLLAAPLIFSAPQRTGAQTPGTPTTNDLIDRIFEAREFTPRPVPQPQWVDGGVSYILVETGSRGSGETRVVKYDSATGERREVLITSAQLTPERAGAPLDIKVFDFMTYPDRTHAIEEGPGTSAHLFHLLTRYLTAHLPSGPRATTTNDRSAIK
jgi:hypothetical protein